MPRLSATRLSAPHLSAVKLKSAAFLVLLAPLAGCGTTDRINPSTSIALDDYRARHPIVIAETRTALDVLPSMAQGHLDSHTAKQVYAFAQQYRDTGRGSILILLPRGRSAGEPRAIVTDLRRALSAGGAHGGVEVSTYSVANPDLASPVRLSFNGIKAKETDPCGQWPRDLASASSVDGWENQPYWNLGCATQTMIAAQTSDPRDLVAPRGEEPADTEIRDRGITAIRAGSDPNTKWSVSNSSIGSVGGGS